MSFHSANVSTADDRSFVDDVVAVARGRAGAGLPAALFALFWVAFYDALGDNDSAV